MKPKSRIIKLDSKTTLFLLLFFICFFTILPYLGLTDFHTKGEPREAIVSVSMLKTGNWTLPINNGVDIAYKPPLFHWLVALTSLPEGHVTESSARFPSAVAAIVIALSCFLFFARRTNNNTAFLSSLLFLSTFEVHRAAMTARVDMVLTMFIVLALIFLYKWGEKGMRGIPFWASVMMGLATLTKGPVGIILPCIVMGIFMLVRKKNFWKVSLSLLATAIISCILPALWYLAAYKQGGDAFLNLVLEENFGRFMGKMPYESHEQNVLYYVYTTLFGFLPWSLLVVFSLFTFHYHRPAGKIKEWLITAKNKITGMSDVRLYSFLTFAIILLFYCIPKSKRSVYLLPIYPFLAFFLAEYMLYLLKNRRNVWLIFGKFIAILTSLVLLVFVILKSHIIPVSWLDSSKLATIKYYVSAFENYSLGIGTVICMSILVIIIYQLWRSKREIELNNRYVYSVIALFMFLQITLDAIILPIILNAKSMKPFAEKITHIVPEGNIYYYTGEPMMRFFVVSFYNNDRTVDFIRENPREGYLLVGQNDFEYIRTHYGNQYTFTQKLKSDRKGNDVKDIIYVYHFKSLKDNEN